MRRAIDAHAALPSRYRPELQQFGLPLPATPSDAKISPARLAESMPLRRLRLFHQRRATLHIQMTGRAAGFFPQRQQDLRPTITGQFAGEVLGFYGVGHLARANDDTVSVVSISRAACVIRMISFPRTHTPESRNNWICVWQGQHAVGSSRMRYCLTIQRLENLYALLHAHSPMSCTAHRDRP